MPPEWDRNSSPVALPRCRTNQRPTTVAGPTFSGLLNMIRPIASAA